MTSEAGPRAGNGGRPARAGPNGGAADDPSLPSRRGDGASGRLLAALHADVDLYPTAMARIAKYISDKPEQVLQFSVAELGEFAGAGPASVIRLCRKLGFDGFRDFKLALAADLARRPEFDRESDEGLYQAIFTDLHSRLTSAVRDLRNSLDEACLTDVADRLIASRRVDVFGAGASGIVGQYLAFRLLRRGLTAQAFTDPSIADEIANGLDERAVAIGISVTGVTPNTVHFLQNARISRAFTVALTDRPSSPITDHADRVILTATRAPDPDGALLAMSPRIFMAEYLGALVAVRQRERK